MNPEDVNSEWVEKGVAALYTDSFAEWRALPSLHRKLAMGKHASDVATILAAVMPLAQAAALAKHLDAYIEWQPRMGDSNAAFATLREMAAEVNRLREGNPS